MYYLRVYTTTRTNRKKAEAYNTADFSKLLPKHKKIPIPFRTEAIQPKPHYIV